MATNNHGDIVKQLHKCIEANASSMGDIHPVSSNYLKSANACYRKAIDLILDAAFTEGKSQRFQEHANERGTRNGND